MIKSMLGVVLFINSFAGIPEPQTILTTHAPCAWGLGLAVTPGTNGTAFIIGNRREVLTNLHVIDRHCLGNRRFTFSHGFDLGRALSAIPATVVAYGDYCSGPARGKHNAGGDWAVAVLDRDPAVEEHIVPPRLLEVLATGVPSGAHYFLLGYGVLFRGGYHLYRAGPCHLGRRYADGLVEHDCATSPRSSGAPIVMRGTQNECSVAALNEGSLAQRDGQPLYRPGINANVAVLSNRFAPAVEAVTRALDKGRSAGEIAAEFNHHLSEPK